ncbi:MAG: hypothetical protein QXH32_06130 [Candidatus Caldarchaeum sp.]
MSNPDEIGKEHVVQKGVSPLHIVLTAVMSGVLALMILFAAITTTVVPGVAALYPATAFEVVFGIWFGVWGGIASYIGLVIAGTYGGWFPLPLGIVLSLSDFAAAMIPAAAFRLLRANPTLASKKDVAVYIIFGVILSSVIPSLYYNLINLSIGWIPGWEAFWVAVISWNVGNYLVTTVIGIPLLRLVTPYVKKAGLYVERWLA